MRISHRELEACLNDPDLWVKEQVSGSTRYFRFGYNRLLVFAIHLYHRTGSLQLAFEYMNEQFESNDLTDKERRAQALRRLASYAAWIEDTATVVSDSLFRISLDLGHELTLGGEISRLDLVPGGYRAVVVGEIPPSWDSELRTPLIQKAVALHFQRPLEEYEVAFHDLDSQTIVRRRFTPEEVSVAERAAEGLARTVMEEYRRLSRTVT